MHSEVTGWILAGGEGRRMGGLDKGLQPYQGQLLVQWVLDSLRGQLKVVHINANRHPDQYRSLLDQTQGPHGDGQVWPDDTDLRGALGPLAGLLTGLRHCDTPWLLSASCDSPHLSPQLVERLVQAATDQKAEVAVPTTVDPDGTVRHHWVCALIHQHCRASLESAIQQGERRVGQWIKSCRWISVSFGDPAAFMNINTLETLHGQA